jgi:hypothetical protein
MNLFHTAKTKTVESRSLTALHLKVLSHKAAGWVVDGPRLQVTDFSRNKRAVTRYSQALFRTGAPWDFVAQH